jgi:hypothetical protein
MNRGLLPESIVEDVNIATNTKLLPELTICGKQRVLNLLQA